MIKSKIMMPIVGVLLILNVAVGGYAVYNKVMLSKVEAERITLINNISKAESVIEELTVTLDDARELTANLESSIEYYIKQTIEDDKNIKDLKWRLGNVSNAKIDECLNDVLIPDDIIDSLYHKD